MTRVARVSGRSGRPWHKRGTQPMCDEGYARNLAFQEIPWTKELAVHRAHAERGDAAALVEAVRRCHETGETIPGWIVAALEGWLAEFVAGGTTRPAVEARRPLFAHWGRTWYRVLCDRVIGSAIELNRDVYAMTEAEALDQASCHFRGTALAGNPATLRKAWQRARRHSRDGWQRRLPTAWEAHVAARLAPTESDAGAAWWAINGSRFGDGRGEWRVRPRHDLSMLSPADLTRQAEAARNSRPKTTPQPPSVKVSGRKQPKSRTDT
jgi:hypothetical protein